MVRDKKNILCVNGGSSSIKFALFEQDGDAEDGNAALKPLLKGKIDRIGLDGAKLAFTDVATGEAGETPVGGNGMEGAANFLLDWIEGRPGGRSFSAIGHRVVHGGPRRQPALIDEALLTELERISGYDPDHLPGEIGLIRLFSKRNPAWRQVACFDTAFHATMPRVARLLPLPRKYEAAGLQRYGFHGLSYAYIAEELVRVAGPVIAGGKVVIAHLGNGASLAAVRGGESADTTMGFTPTGGIIMGTRSGDVDPGAIWWIMQQEGLGAEQLSKLVNHQSGLLGVSGASPDMQDLLSREASDPAAADAVGLFIYQVKKSIGAFAAVLEGVDALVFTGGIGEHSPVVRSRVCAGMEWLGIGLDEVANERNELRISLPDRPVQVYTIPTDEEKMIARQSLKLLNV